MQGILAKAIIHIFAKKLSMRFYSFMFILPVLVFAQQPDTIATRFSKHIIASDMKKNLSVLASDEYEGRETGQKGQKMSAEYIKKYYQDLGIKPLNSKEIKDGYFQQYPLEVFDPQEVKLTLGKRSFRQNADFFSWANTIGDTSLSIDEITFCGYGINTLVYTDYAQLNLSDKAVMVLDGEPVKTDGTSAISQSAEPSPWAGNYRTKQSEAKKQGIRYLFIVDKDLQQSRKQFEHKISSSRMSTGNKASLATPLVFYISREMADEIIASTKNTSKNIEEKIQQTNKTVTFTVKAPITLVINQKQFGTSAENVLAYIEGTDLKDELVILSAHYDHLGIQDGKVYNGADDDGSGTVAVMQLAKAFQEAKKQGKGPRRSVLFLNVSGEEKGLLGSDYYTNYPIFPLSNTVCDLNIDMIGRLDDAHKNNSNYIYLIGSDKLSKDLHALSEKMNKVYTQLELDYRYNDENEPNRYYYRSDHYNFAKNGIPVIFYFNGVHADYHQETDEVGKIDFNKMEKITKFVFYNAWEIANRTERLKADAPRK
jgi:hypothetical protein